VTTNSIQRTVRMGVLSTFLALAAFAFLAFGSASAHTLNSAQTTSGTTATVSRIVTNSQGGAVFSPSAITIKSGTPVRIVNKTAFARFLVINGQLFRLNSGTSMTITPVQSQTVFICGGSGTLTITVV
jgi:plastocyanin